MRVTGTTTPSKRMGAHCGLTAGIIAEVQRTPSAEVMSRATTVPPAITAPALATEAISTPSNDPDAQYRNSLNANWFAAGAA